jgi:hypothetical protein
MGERGSLGAFAALWAAARRSPKRAVSGVALAVVAAAAIDVVGAPLTVSMCAALVCAIAAVVVSHAAARGDGGRVGVRDAALVAVLAALGWALIAVAVRPFAVLVLVTACGVALLTGATARPSSGRRPGTHVNVDGSPKREYRSRSSAQEAADRLHAKDGAAMGVYRCEKGGHWHVGHQR